MFLAEIGEYEVEVVVPAGSKPGDSLTVDVPWIYLGEELTGEPAATEQNLRSKKPRRQVSFTEEEPAVLLFAPELGGLQEPCQRERKEFESVVEIIVPDGTFAGDVLTVQVDGSDLEVVVPDGCVAGQMLTVHLPADSLPEGVDQSTSSPGQTGEETVETENERTETSVAGPDAPSEGTALGEDSSDLRSEDAKRSSDAPKQIAPSAAESYMDAWTDNAAKPREAEAEPPEMETPARRRPSKEKPAWRADPDKANVEESQEVDSKAKTTAQTEGEEHGKQVSPEAKTTAQTEGEEHGKQVSAEAKTTTQTEGEEHGKQVSPEAKTTAQTEGEEHGKQVSPEAKAKEGEEHGEQVGPEAETTAQTEVEEHWERVSLEAKTTAKTEGEEHEKQVSPEAEATVQTDVEEHKEQVMCKADAIVQTDVEEHKEHVSCKAEATVQTDVEEHKEQTSCKAEATVQTDVEEQKEQVSCKAEATVQTDLEEHKEQVSCKAEATVQTDVEEHKKQAEATVQTDVEEQKEQVSCKAEATVQTDLQEHKEQVSCKAEATVQTDLEEHKEQVSCKAEATVQTDVEEQKEQVSCKADEHWQWSENKADLRAVRVALKGEAWRPPLPSPATPGSSRSEDDATVQALKMALTAMKKEKEDLQQKLNETLKEKVRLELRDRESYNAAYAEAMTTLKQENQELRSIALAALRQNEADGKAGKREQKVNLPDARIPGSENAWLRPSEKKREAPRREPAQDSSSISAGPAGGSHGIRRSRSCSDGSLRSSSKEAPPDIWEKDLDKDVGLQVQASPCGSARKATSRPASAASRSGDAKEQTTCFSKDVNLTTAAIYAGAAASAEVQGWGATAKAAKAACQHKCKDHRPGPPAPPLPPGPPGGDWREELHHAVMSPLSAVEPAQVCQRAANGAIVLEVGQQDPDLRCVDEVNRDDGSKGMSPSSPSVSLDDELHTFFTGGAYFDGELLSACCGAYTLVDDGSASHNGDAVPLYRHASSGCLLLGSVVSLTSHVQKDTQLVFCRGPLPTMRRFSQGLLGCVEIVFELLGGGSSQGRGFSALREGPGRENAGETGGSAESLCYLPILAETCHLRSWPARSDGSGPAQCFVKVADMPEVAGIALNGMERRLRAEVYSSDQEGRPVRSLAHFLASMGQVEEAAELWQHALNEDKAKLGSIHLQTAAAASALAACLDDLGRSQEAEGFHCAAKVALEMGLGRASAEATACELALTACRHVQGHGRLHGILPSHAQPGVLSLQAGEAQAVAMLFSKAVSADEASDSESFYRQVLCVLRRSLGSYHPDTLHCLNNLALCLGDQGKLQQAELLLRRTLAGMEVVLPSSHPRPIQALSNLACCLAEQGKLEEAESHHRRAFDTCKRKLGWKHPETSSCAHSLSDFLKSCGRSTEAALIELQADQLGRQTWRRTNRFTG
ncbi:unnamed protein product [Effrenium voratum]|uniref:Tetratricopeptide repeat-containing protein n=1 Tax=Effrenium voratum TaxID=2562239 RepID=A0AA36ISG9_9DINO|nr:unnamed protein product [Effrenium voratum]